MRTTHWKLFPGFVLGLLVMWTAGSGVMLLLMSHPALLDAHWGIWLAVTILFPILAIAAHLKAANIRALYLLSYFLNTLGAGCTFGVVMGYVLEEPVSRDLLMALLLSMLPALAAMLIVCVIFSVFRRDKLTAILFSVLGIVAVFVGLVNLGPGAFFSFLFFLPMPLACAKTLGKPWSAERYLSFSGFGAYLVVMLAGIMLLTEDGPEGLFDIIFDGIGEVADTMTNPQKKQNHP